MAHIAHIDHLMAAAPRRRSTTPVPAKPGLFQRIYDALAGANRRQAERDMAHFVSAQGRFTDAIEREISERSLGSDWNVRDHS